MNSYDFETMGRPSPTALLNPRCDPIFKAIFTQGTEQSNLALKDFISAMLNRNIEKVELRPNELPVETLNQIQMSFDVSVTFDDGESADIEIQGRNQDYDYAIRSEIQAARLLNNNAKKGSNWNVSKVYQISVLNFEFDSDDNNPLSWYTMRKETGKTLGNRLNVIFLDLVKVRKFTGRPVNEMSPAEKWGMFFSYADDENQQNYIREISESDEGIMAADFTVKYMSEEDANWFTQNSYFIGQRDYNTGMENAEKRGLARGMEQGLAKGLSRGLKQGIRQGIQEGIQKKTVEDAKNFYANGVSVEIIAKSLNMSIEQAEKIIKTEN